MLSSELTFKIAELESAAALVHRTLSPTPQYNWRSSRGGGTRDCDGQATADCGKTSGGICRAQGERKRATQNFVDWLVQESQGGAAP